MQELIESHESLPWQRRGYLREAMLDQLLQAAGFEVTTRAPEQDQDSVREFLDHVVKSTNMRCLTPPSALAGECGFLAANLYAKSVFGEDALVNVSVEKQPSDGKLGGYIRIRSKTQGIALSLGDKITLKQRVKDEE